VKQLADENPALRTVWHPAPEGELITCQNITIAVLQGDVKGQINTGEFVEI
jgi:hypothetical protein